MLGMGMRMNFNLQDFLNSEFGISDSIIKVSAEIEEKIRDSVKEIEATKEYNQIKVIKAMQKYNLSDSHFAGTTGYGYDDRGRDILDCVYADVFKAEDALVRHQIVSGTQALALCLFGNLRPGDELLSITGKPYDTLEEVIGIRGEGAGSLKEFGITYRQVDLLPDSVIDFNAVKEAINAKTKLVFIQRSRGYSWRPALKVSEIGRAIEYIKFLKNDVIVLVDNCYGEFVEEREPTEVGADIVAGSLIKNPGGGLAPSGGYVAGKEVYVKNAANRLTSPGLGKKVGASLDNNRLLFQGFFMAPHVVAESLKGAIFCSALMQELGYETSPLYNEKRGDIIQAIKFNNPEDLILFCQGIQKGSPVDSFVIPQPWDMPGYDCPVIMAAGAFIQGASIELSADAPIKPPYIAYVQGGLVYEHVKLGVLTAVQMLENSFIKR
jgi:cystathionine beta-lyase family protein involved in aluminum resistance